MKITVLFENMQELDEFCNGIAPALARACRKENAEAATEAKEAPKAKKSTSKKAEAQEEAKTEEKEAPEESIEHAPDYTAGAGKKVTESQVKVLLSEKLKAGKKAEVKELFGKYGVEKLSELIEKHPDKLDEFYKDAEGI